MDNGGKEKAMANDIKKAASRQIIGSQRFRLVPKLLMASPAGPSSYGNTSNAGRKAIGPVRNSPHRTVDRGTAPTRPELQDDNIVSKSPLLPTMTSTETVLLMHFLDKVFPLQYPLYTPNIIQGGRGWVLSLLLRNAPLYHAALALSALHRKSSLLVANREKWRMVSETQQETHLSICLTEFQNSIRNLDQWLKEEKKGDILGIMASIVQLVYFELFSGNCSTWHIHLRAATDLFRGPYMDRWVSLKLMGPSNATSLPDTTSDEDNFLVPEDEAASRFLWGVVIWLDIISCVTTGKSPRLLSVHDDAISASSQIQLENIMGCKNWVMLQMSNIAALQEHKTRATRDGSIDATAFEKRADVIRKELQNWLTADFLEHLRITNLDPPPSNLVVPSTALVTRMFALTAFIYHHVVVSGFQLQTDELNTTIWEAMTLLRTLVPITSMHTIVCPLYIIGCVAKGEDKDFFRNIFSKAPLLEPSLVHRSKILAILEQIWHVRDTTPDGWTWEESIRLSNSSLLLV